MASIFTLKALGINSQPNQLEIPEGSLSIAKNVTIDRDGVVQSRRGYSIYGDAMGTSSDRAKQLLDYKLRILRHYDSILQFDSDGAGNFEDFAGALNETEAGLRIKSIEANGNLYITTAAGIRKISARTAADFTTAAGFITNAGAVKAVDIAGVPVYTYGEQTGFLPQDSAVAYRAVWGYRDLNNNLILGAPSQRIEVYNPILSLMLPDYQTLLGALDNIGRTGSTLIDDQDYLSTLGLPYSASSSELRTNLISLAAKLDNNIQLADNDGAPTGAPLEIDTVVISSGVCTVTFASGDPTLYLVSGSSIRLNGFTPGTSGTLDGVQTVASLTSTTLTFNTTAVGIVTISGSTTIYSNTFRAIPEPSVQSIPATAAELVELQDYITFIIEALIAEPNAIINDAVSATYISVLDVTTSANVLLTVTIPEDIDSNYFVQIYRSAIFTATDTQVLSTDVFPNDELQLVYEAYPTTDELAAGEMTILDVVPDAFRGANLYTNASTGEGILQSNDLPPFAKDINVFKNSVFYANTHTRQRKELSLLGVQNMIADALLGNVPTFTISTETGSNTYTFVIGVSEVFTVTTVPGSSLAAAGTASYFDAYSGLDERSYRFWYQIGTAVAPADGGHTLVSILADAADTDAIIASKTRDAFNIINQDFSATSLTNVVTTTLIQPGTATDASAGTSGFTVVVTVPGVGENIAAGQILLSNDVSPAIAVQETAQSLARVLNQNTLEQIYVYYTSGAQEVPGKMVFEARSLSDGQFFITTNNSNTGASFSPSVAPTSIITSIAIGSPTTNLVTTATAHGLTNLDYVFISGSNSTPSIDGYQQITYVSATTFRVNATITVAGTTGSVTPYNSAESSSNEDAPNRVYYSKYQQPEAVPILNYFDVGAKDRAILRIFPLRDSLFIFKEDGVYRISGESIPFNLALFDGSVQLQAPDSLASVDNVIYGWTESGITSVTESGTRNVSRPLDIDLLPLSSAKYPNFNTATWGVGYDSDNSYIAYTVKAVSDTYAKIGYKFNIITNTWTTTERSFICGINAFHDDKMYVGAGDTNFIEKERKEFDRTDYADREYDLNVLPNGTSLTLFVDDVSDINVDDVFVQEQTVTAYTFNSLLKKLDLDSGVADNTYFSTLEAGFGDDMRDKLVELAVKLDADSLGFSDYEAAINSLSGALTIIGTGAVPIITSAAHGLMTGRKVLLSSTDSVPTINGEFEVTVTGVNTFTINPGFTVTTAGTTGTFSTLVSDFDDLLTCYNIIITKLNADTVVSFSNYQPIENTTIQESRISAVNRVTKKITLAVAIPYIEGAFKSFESIDCLVQYAPNTFGGDPVSLKHMREAQMLFESLAFTKGIISFATDLLPMFEEVEFTADGTGIFGFTPFGEGFFGGASHSAPIRTYIPRNCQRCRYMVVKFNHKVAREKWSLFGISLVGETDLSSRAYK